MEQIGIVMDAKIEIKECAPEGPYHRHGFVRYGINKSAASPLCRWEN